jgi:hypothetical protein
MTCPRKIPTMSGIAPVRSDRQVYLLLERSRVGKSLVEMTDPCLARLVSKGERARCLFWVPPLAAQVQTH